ncbi:MAG: hypothetical protein J7574_05495 [Flavobacterium sp.]|uniref:hypothetical protein n=1 Tax=Flavobacterium sp. TaxID=239 RepID=UPI001B2815A8|nr:hypothetical protein [Flavobacterium sp.]MBO9583595.1 hypothetical protein [Flavobacterium sp.]
MKIRIYSIVFIFLSFFFASCTSDSIDDQVETSGGSLKTVPNIKEKERVNEEVIVKASDSIYEISALDSGIDPDGDPSNPRPPRK